MPGSQLCQSHSANPHRSGSCPQGKDKFTASMKVAYYTPLFSHCFHRTQAYQNVLECITEACSFRPGMGYHIELHRPRIPCSMWLPFTSWVRRCLWQRLGEGVVGSCSLGGRYSMFCSLVLAMMIFLAHLTVYNFLHLGTNCQVQLVF